MRILLDYRPALRARTGVGEYVHQLARRLALGQGDELTLFTSSWKDRPDTALREACPGASVSDHRIPVSLLNLAWHRLEWPPVERLAPGDYDVVFSPHPLLTPSRRAAQVVTVHDVDFLDHPERTRGEIRRDYPRLAASHTRRAERVIVSSQHAASAVHERLGVPRERICVCPAGSPEWADPLPASPAYDGYALFVGTLEARKNVGLLLDAYARLLTRCPGLPKLVIAGAATPDAQRWLDALARPPLAGHVDHLGYIPDADRQRVYSGARVLVLPSFHEGFGLPVLEAMSLGVPVIASDRGALPEVVGDAGILVSPDAPHALDDALERVLTDNALVEALFIRGRDRARRFSWNATALTVRAAFQEAVNDRAGRH